LAVPGGLLALIQENAALLFWDIPDSKPVWLSGAFSQLKITANSTYWKAKLGSYGLGIAGVGCEIGKRGEFSLSPSAPEPLSPEKLVIKLESNNVKDQCAG
jgi:hypothetical protein